MTDETQGCPETANTSTLEYNVVGGSKIALLAVPESLINMDGKGEEIALTYILTFTDNHIYS